MTIRQPIVTVCGHVDHGKTTLLDYLRQSSVAEKEAGRITQKISFTLFPADAIKKGCYLIDKHGIGLKIPGVLFIDTPGHAAFTNLRKRGGSLADLAILVIDINEGIKPQTAEVLSILKANKTPFIIGLNKIDNISGWKKQDEDLKKSIEMQAMRTKQDFDKKFFTIIGALNNHGFNADIFYNVPNFTKKIALIPISAKTGEGIAELLMVLCGLSQKFLSKQLSLGEKARGVILEIKKERTMQYIEAILYDGKLKVGDEIAIASFGSPIITKIRAIEEIQPIRDKFKPVKNVTAATGIRIQVTESKEVLPGMPFMIYEGDMTDIEKEFKKELKETIKTDKDGIIVKADSLGSLEALLTLLRESNIKILKTGIGPISKSDISSAKANEESKPENAIILGFNVNIDEEAKEMEKEVKILTDDVIYKLIEELEKWQDEKRKEIEREKLMKLAVVCKLEILPEYVFRNSKPAIFGIRVLGGKIKPRIELINEQGDKVSRVKNVQEENKSVEQAEERKEVAISLTGITFDRQLKDVKYLYSNISEKQFKEFKKNKELLSKNELKVLQEIAQIKRKEKITWGV